MTEICVVIGVATVCTLIFDLPMQAISRMILVQGIEEDIAAEIERQNHVENNAAKPEQTDAGDEQDSGERAATPTSANDNEEQTGDELASSATSGEEDQSDVDAGVIETPGRNKVSFAPNVEEVPATAIEDDGDGGEEDKDEITHTITEVIVEEEDDEDAVEPDDEPEPDEETDDGAMRDTNGQSSPTVDDAADAGSTTYEDDQMAAPPSPSGESQAFLDEDYDRYNRFDDTRMRDEYSSDSEDSWAAAQYLDDNDEDYRVRIWRNNY